MATKTTISSLSLRSTASQLLSLWREKPWVAIRVFLPLALLQYLSGKLLPFLYPLLSNPILTFFLSTFVIFLASSISLSLSFLYTLQLREISFNPPSSLPSYIAKVLAMLTLLAIGVIAFYFVAAVLSLPFLFLSPAFSVLTVLAAGIAFLIPMFAIPPVALEAKGWRDAAEALLSLSRKNIFYLLKAAFLYLLLIFLSSSLYKILPNFLSPTTFNPAVSSILTLLLTLSITTFLVSFYGFVASELMKG